MYKCLTLCWTAVYDGSRAAALMGRAIGPGSQGFVQLYFGIVWFFLFCFFADVTMMKIVSFNKQQLSSAR